MDGAPAEAVASPGHDDRSLVGQVAAGSEAALATLYDRHWSSVFRVAVSMAGDRGAAEEVVQETFLALWNRAELFDAGLGSLSTWLIAIARNRARDHLRWTGRRVAAAPFSVIAGDATGDAEAAEWIAASGVVLGAGAPEPAPDVSAAASETQELIAAALGVLPAAERQAILLAYRDGLSQSEIAALLGWPLGTVKTRSRRALRRLREALGSSLDDECCAGAEKSA